MNDRDLYVATVLGEPVDRPPFWLYWSPWSRTWQRWEREGKPAHLARFQDLRTLFGADRTPVSVPVNCGPCPRIERAILQEDADYVVYVDDWGITRRDYKHGESMSDFLDFPIKARHDWEQFKRERLDPDCPDRLSGNWRDQCAAWRAQGIPIRLGSYPDVGLFGTVRWLLGAEEALMAFCTMPDLVHEIMDHMTSLYLAVFDQVVRHVQIDEIHLWEDMCYRNGPLISPQHWDTFMGPNYQRIKAFADAHDIPIISVDTDGNPDMIASPMIQAGVNLLFPMEVAAGCDVNVWQHKYPTLSMLGGIDKRALAQGPAAIDHELERIRPAVENGRYIPTLDHLVPDDVSWENYQHYANALGKLVGKQKPGI
jgi:uroporphyrinogen decarboxylase